MWSVGGQPRLRPLELPCTHRHTECTVTKRAITTIEDPETSWATPTHWVNEKMPTLNGWERLRHTLTINPTPAQCQLPASP